MECREAAELLDTYVLGTLDDEEREHVERHLASCADCESQLSDAGELAVHMAYSVPRLVAPDRVKLGLFERIDRLGPISAPPQRPSTVLAALRSAGGFWRASAGYARLAMAAAFAVLVIGGGVWFNDRLDTVSHENSVLKARLDDVESIESELTAVMNDHVAALSEDQHSLTTMVKEMSESEGEMIDMIKDQQDMAYMLASPDKLVSVLSSTSQATATAGSEAQGLIIFEGEGASAFLTTRELPANAEGSLYRVWLVRHGFRHDAGVFSVDPTGYGQAIIIPVGSWDEIEAIEITAVLSGESVLQGDL
jgi:anti-sigma-K factor RskA